MSDFTQVFEKNIMYNSECRSLKSLPFMFTLNYGSACRTSASDTALLPQKFNYCPLARVIN